MPGGALTANTQMMRDNNSFHLFTKVIENMREVVAKGGYGTSVTPVSQFYWQQAFSNVMFGNWKKIADGYGKMVLGYFGKTPTKPNDEIVKLASEQLKLEPRRHQAERSHNVQTRLAGAGDGWVLIPFTPPRADTLRIGPRGQYIHLYWRLDFILISS